MRTLTTTAARLTQRVRFRALFSHDPTDHVDRLAQEGYIHLPKVISPAHVSEILDQTERAIDTGQLVAPAIRKPGRDADDRSPLAGPADIVYVRDPLVVVPSAASALMAAPLIDLAWAYYRSAPALVGPRIVRSYVNELPPTTVHRFHCDFQRPRFLKFLLYLTEVSSPDDGPFCFVAGSHRAKPRGWRRHEFSWTDAEIEQFYGAPALRIVTGGPGDVVAADTRGFHRAFKVRTRARTIAKASTSLLAWREGSWPVDRLGLSTLDGRQRAWARYLSPVAVREE